MQYTGYWLLITCSFLFWKCGNNLPPSAQSKLYIVTTTGMLGDAVSVIAGDNAKVESLMGPGVDPHLYKATQSDLGKLSSADMIVYNGLFLEGKMEDILEKLGQAKKTVAVGDRLDPARVIKTSAGSLSFDPHIWFDVALWMEAVKIISQALQELDTVHAEEYQQNAEVYLQELHQLDEWVKNEIAAIPEEQRMLITSHDAFGYFGKAYCIEVHGLQGISTASDFGLQDITRLVNLIVERKVKAVFIETSVAPRSLQAVVEGCTNLGYEVNIGGTLYSDAMGEPGTPEGTYIGMVKANVNTIVRALK